MRRVGRNVCLLFGFWCFTCLLGASARRADAEVTGKTFW